MKTSREMRALGATIPTAWLLLLPGLGVYWFFKWCRAVSYVTNRRTNTGAAFILSMMPVIGVILLQSEFNQVKKLSDQVYIQLG